VKKFLFTACLFLLAGCSNTWQNLPASTQDSRDAIRYYLKKYPSHNRVYAKTAITDEQSAVAAAEEILFPVYGKEIIRDEHPYTVGYADGYWIVHGYLPNNSKGDVFNIVLFGKTSEVVSIMHGK
jgi:hypothetical protein